MPTIQQLPHAVSVNPTDVVMLDQSGTTVSAKVSQVLATAAGATTLTGDVTGSGTGTIVTTLAPVATPGTYGKVSVNAKGLVVAGTALQGVDVTSALGFMPYNATNPAGYVPASQLAPVATSGQYASLSGLPALGGMAAQQPGAVAITGGSVAADVSAATVVAGGATTPRSLAARAAERIDVLDFGADPSGVADSAPAFAAAMAAVPVGGWGCVRVPPGTYRLNSFLNQPSGRSVSFAFDEGAITTGPGGLGVDRVESKQGPYRLWQGGGGWFGFNPVVGSQPILPFNNDLIQNAPNNSGASRVAWARSYTNLNYYGKYATGIDIAEQNIFIWPHLYDNSSGWGHWEVIIGTTLDEDSQSRAHLITSAEHSEYDVVNNGLEAGWTFRSGVGNAVQGMSLDAWGQNGNYGGNILFAYGSVGSFDGNAGGLNWRWPSYPAVFSNGNPPAVPQNSTIVLSFDVTAHATASVAGGAVTGVSITSGGGLYTSPPTVVFSGGGGSGATGTAVMLAGSVVKVTMTAGGSGYTSAPAVSFTGGGVAAPATTTVTLNPDGAHGDLASVAAAINAANIPLLRASVAKWGGVVNRLAIFGTAGFDLGTLTLGGSALGPLGITPMAYATPRDQNVVVLGGTGNCAPGDQFTLNGVTITVGGAGTPRDVVNAVSAANPPGLRADVTASGQLALICWVPQNPGGLVIGQPAGFATLGKLGLPAGTFWPPTPPKAFATAQGELSSPICQVTDQISLSATDLNGTVYGPVTITLNGGGGTGWIADVAASIRAAVTAAGFYSSTPNMLSAAPAVVNVQARGSGGTQGLQIRNTAGGTLTLANVTGTPLQTLGLVAGTYQPGGYSAASQSVFMAAEDSIAPQGRGIFLGGASTPTDRTTWPNTPLEARGSFLHGMRTDKAVFDDNLALVLGAGQGIGFGSGAGSVTLSAGGGALQANGAPLALASAVPARLSQLSNDAGFLTAAPVASVAGRGGAVTLSSADLGDFAAAAAASAPVQSVAGRSGAVTLTHADLTDWAAATAGFLSGQQWTAGPVSSVVGGSVAAGTLSVTGAVSSVFGRTGAVSLGSADVTGALGFAPLAASGGTLAGGTLSGGTLVGSVTASGTLSITGAASAPTPAAGDNSGKLATTGFVWQATSAAASIATTGGSITLSAAQYGAPVLIVTGTLTANAILVVPGNGVWTVANRTTGAFSLTVKTAVGSGVAVDQGTSAELLADGANVVLATSDFNAITLQGSVTNAGTIGGGTVAPVTLVVGGSGSLASVARQTDQAGYQPIVVAAGGSNGNVPLVLAPAGSGYLAAALSNGVVSGGAARGVYAVDWQQSRAAAGQVASGAYAVVPGGSGNTAAGSYSFAAGQGSSATGQGSVALGQYASDGGAYGKLVFSGNAATVGNQWAVSTLFASSVSTATRMTTDGGAAGGANSIPIRSNHVIAGTLTVAARNVATGDGACWTIPVLFRNSAGSVVVTSPGSGAIAPTAADASLAGASVTVAADNTNKGLSVTITPPASTTLSASAVFLATEM